MMVMDCTLGGPVVPIGDKHYDLGMDGAGRLCHRPESLTSDSFATRSMASRAGIWTEPDGEGGLFCARPSANGLTWVPLEPCATYRTPCEGLDVLRANYGDAKAKLGADANPPTHRRDRAVAVGMFAISDSGFICGFDGIPLENTDENRRKVHEAGIRGVHSSRLMASHLRAGWIETSAEFDGSGATLENGTTGELRRIVMDEPLHLAGTMSIGPGGMIGDDSQLVSPGALDPRTTHLVVDELRREMGAVLGGVPAESLDRLRAMLPSVLALGGERTDMQLAEQLDAMKVGMAETRRETIDGGYVTHDDDVMRQCILDRCAKVARRLPAGDLITDETQRFRNSTEEIMNALKGMDAPTLPPMHAGPVHDTHIAGLTSDVVDAARASLLPTDKGAAVKVATDALVKAYGFEFDEAMAAVTGAVRVAASMAPVESAPPIKPPSVKR